MDKMPRYFSHKEKVPEPLSDVYSHFYFATNDSEQPVINTFVPHFKVMLIFSLGTPISIHLQGQPPLVIEHYFMLGPVKKTFEYCMPPKSSITVINFNHDGFHRLFGTGSVDTDLLAVDNNCFLTMWQTLQTLPTLADSTQYLLSVGEKYLSHQNALNLEINPTQKATDVIKQLAQQQGKNRRTLQMQYKKRLGFSAQEFDRYQRFVKTIELIQQHTSANNIPDWADVVFECGYYDQSHLIRDFQHFLSMTPSQYLAIQQQICLAQK
ncbi:AraC family transcriptional regulator [Vibrio nitrifigilis]|uniref:AraC family transcriptional regulator n=1 Tax=Vibrio nitrifigilis TaxID=2789781 RepID=A0ABS0GF06_9VIBR|nr:helix-turn-helix domain-containing protein [Vibrio nitrifigilis]MBF9000993.1 AraC family transcriptional regulator [Vibrio nitrifigilis]